MTVSNWVMRVTYKDFWKTLIYTRCKNMCFFSFIEYLLLNKKSYFLLRKWEENDQLLIVYSLQSIRNIHYAIKLESLLR